MNHLFAILGKWNPPHWTDTQRGGQFSERTASASIPCVLSHCPPFSSWQWWRSKWWCLSESQRAAGWVQWQGERVIQWNMSLYKEKKIYVFYFSLIHLHKSLLLSPFSLPLSCVIVSAGSRLCHTLSYSWGHYKAWRAPHVTSSGHVGERGSNCWAGKRRVRTWLQHPGLPG